jgi:WW domain-binding protein 4
MGSDKQSILIHQNGRKHKLALEASLTQRREDKSKEEKRQSFLEKSMRQMEEAAAVAVKRDVLSGAFRSSHLGGTCVAVSQGLSALLNAPPPAVGYPQTKGETKAINKADKSAWEDRKEKRKQMHSKDNDDNEADEPVSKKQKIKVLGPNEGHYTINDNTYLQGHSYSSLFEEDMPIELWIGSSTMSEDYKKSKEALEKELWKPALIVKVTKARTKDNPTSNNDAKDGDDIKEERLCIVAYLKYDDDEDETIEKQVKADRIRLILGSDELIPSTIEEARLSLMGGEEVVIMPNTTAESINQQVDENTGLTGWGTVSVRKVAVNQEVKEERARLRAKRREERDKELNRERDIEERRKEEAKHSNADDSALGAYDVWSTSNSSGYKGVKISDSNVGAQEGETKSLSQGVDVKFKKSMFKKGKKKQTRRKTFVDDDD